MVEGDLIDLTLPSLLQAMTREKASAVLRLQRGTDDGDQGSVYFCEGALVHALAGESVGDEAMYQLLGWSEGRFRLVRDADKQPRTITAASGELHHHGRIEPLDRRLVGGDRQGRERRREAAARPADGAVAARAGQGAPRGTPDRTRRRAGAAC